jgi:rhodanese-related sulfurtransferase
VPNSSTAVEFAVYRGDYIKFTFDEGLTSPTLSIPSLSISINLDRELQPAPYFKMKTTGQYPFSLGQTTGFITVIEYAKPQYRPVTSQEAAELIASEAPLIILDVRTGPEYSGGHLENSIHIPVQEIQQRYGELSSFKDDNILIYCATGNRSTVAAKILIDKGFSHIYNMREGVHVWEQKGYPLVR